MSIEEYIKNIDSQRSWAWCGHLIEGEWHKDFSDSEVRHSENPNTKEVLMEPCISKNAVLHAIESAYEARNQVHELGYEKRLGELDHFCKALGDYSETIVKILQMECGRARWEAEADLDASIRYLKFIVQNGRSIREGLLAPASIGKSLQDFELLPVGVALGYLPFSTPLTTFCTYFSAAMISGCPLVLVSTTHSAALASFLGCIARKIDLTKNLLSLTVCSFKKTRNLFKDRKIAAVMYTGSREHCDGIRKESLALAGRQLMLQSGGKNSLLVHSTADLDAAVRATVYGAFKSAGQLCTSTSRVFVYQNHLQEFVDKLVAVTESLSIGDAEAQPDIFMGPLYAKKAVDKFLRFQTMAQREEAECLMRGKTLPGSGYFVSPAIHLMKSFNASSAYQSNVLFCPDVAVYSYDVLEEAIAAMNQTDAAFAVSYMGDSQYLQSKTHLFAAPNILINQPTCEVAASLPLAGRLQSGHHRFCGPGLAMRLSYPQVIHDSKEDKKIIASWPLS